MNIQLFWEITKRSYQRYLTYRAATLAGLVTNFFFGILRASILVALYDMQTEVEGITLQGAVTYAAMTQATIGLLSLFNWYDVMNSVYSGEIGSDLLKPMNFIRYWMAVDLGRAVVQLVFRGLIVVAGYAFIFDLVWPQKTSQWLAFGVALLFSWLISFLWRFLINLVSFWTPNAMGILRFLFTLSWFFSGFLMPLRFFPDWVIKISYLTPFPLILNTVIEIYLGVIQGPEVLFAIVLQVLWVCILWLSSVFVLRAGVRRLVILGG
jgi:ABC-2 type transport system permease protein